MSLSEPSHLKVSSTDVPPPISSKERDTFLPFALVPCHWPSSDLSRENASEAGESAKTRGLNDREATRRTTKLRDAILIVRDPFQEGTLFSSLDDAGGSLGALADLVNDWD